MLALRDGGMGKREGEELIQAEVQCVVEAFQKTEGQQEKSIPYARREPWAVGWDWGLYLPPPSVSVLLSPEYVTTVLSCVPGSVTSFFLGLHLSFSFSCFPFSPFLCLSDPVSLSLPVCVCFPSFSLSTFLSLYSCLFTCTICQSMCLFMPFCLWWDPLFTLHLWVSLP